MLLNFPNNPTGYMPTPAEGEAIVDALARAGASAARSSWSSLDDAYFGLFYHLGAPLDDGVALRAAREPPSEPARGEARRRDQGALRLGPALRLHHLRPRRRAETAPRRCARCSTRRRAARSAARISNSPQLSQTLVEKALATPSIARRAQGEAPRCCARAPRRSTRSRTRPRFRESWDVYPFNSGYFMCVKVKGVDAEKLRVHLLDAVRHRPDLRRARRDIRVAFSCLELDQIEPLFEALHKAIQELR